MFILKYPLIFASSVSKTQTRAHRRHSTLPNWETTLKRSTWRIISSRANNDYLLSSPFSRERRKRGGIGSLDIASIASESRWSANVTSSATSASSWTTTGHGAWNAERGTGACAYYFFRLAVARRNCTCFGPLLLPRYSRAFTILDGGRSATFRSFFFHLFFLFSFFFFFLFCRGGCATLPDSALRTLDGAGKKALTAVWQLPPLSYIHTWWTTLLHVCACVQLTPGVHVRACTHVRQTNRTKRIFCSVLVHVQRARAYDAWRTRRRDR